MVTPMSTSSYEFLHPDNWVASKGYTNGVAAEGRQVFVGGNNLSSYLGENWFTMLADWCLDRIDGKPAPNERMFINGFGQANVMPYDKKG